MNRSSLLFAAVISGLLIAPSLGVADDAAKAAAKPAPAKAAAAPAEHRHFLPADFVWVDAPPSLPKGAKMAVVHGDPSAPGIFAMRLSLPAGYKVRPHWHPADEHVTVISGVFHMALGETWDPSKGQALPAGAVSIMPVGTRHYAWSDVETVIQVHAMGPWGITYVNPQDDPRNQKQAAK